MPKFAGNEEEWANFREAFKAEVDANPRYSDPLKLRKLLSSLEGRAKKAIGNWTTTDVRSYPLAWAALCKMYDNEYGTIRAHLQKVSALKQLPHATRDGLHDVLDTVRSAQRQLQLLLTPEEMTDHILLYLIERALDSESQTQSGIRRTANELPTLSGMYEFLEVRSSLLAALPKPTGAVRAQEDSRRHNGTGESNPNPDLKHYRFPNE